MRTVHTSLLFLLAIASSLASVAAVADSETSYPLLPSSFGLVCRRGESGTLLLQGSTPKPFDASTKKFKKRLVAVGAEVRQLSRVAKSNERLSKRSRRDSRARIAAQRSRAKVLRATDKERGLRQLLLSISECQALQPSTALGAVVDVFSGGETSLNTPSGERLVIPRDALPVGSRVSVAPVFDPENTALFREDSVMNGGGPALNSSVVVTVGAAQPASDLVLSVPVPRALLDSLEAGSAIRAFARTVEEEDEGGSHTIFEGLSTTFVSETSSVIVIIPPWAFDPEEETSQFRAQITLSQVHVRTVAVSPRSWLQELAATVDGGNCPASLQAGGQCPPQIAFTSPLSNLIVVSAFGPRVVCDKKTKEPKDDYHASIDFRATVGTPVMSMAPGIVKSVNRNPSHPCGLYVVVDHGKDTGQSQYCHLSKVSVNEGMRLEKGGLFLGLSGDTGNVTPHLHVSYSPSEQDVLVKGTRKNPLPCLPESTRLTCDIRKEECVAPSATVPSGATPDGESTVPVPTTISTLPGRTPTVGADLPTPVATALPVMTPVPSPVVSPSPVSSIAPSPLPTIDSTPSPTPSDAALMPLEVGSRWLYKVRVDLAAVGGQLSSCGGTEAWEVLSGDSAMGFTIKITRQRSGGTGDFLFGGCSGSTSTQDVFKQGIDGVSRSGVLYYKVPGNPGDVFQAGKISSVDSSQDPEVYTYTYRDDDLNSPACGTYGHVTVTETFRPGLGRLTRDSLQKEEATGIPGCSQGLTIHSHWELLSFTPPA